MPGGDMGGKMQGSPALRGRGQSKWLTLTPKILSKSGNTR